MKAAQVEEEGNRCTICGGNFGEEEHCPQGHARKPMPCILTKNVQQKTKEKVTGIDNEFCAICKRCDTPGNWLKCPISKTNH
ncbi:MAG: hypothetical protein NTX00_01115 [Candidatus Parcubacteria bacterium]|nr:hypothetical protein [Candidatus Parcubacteria bacterium]